MPKADEVELLEAISENFHTYLRKGVRFDRVIGSAHPELDIDDIEALLRIHFVLTDSRGDPGNVGVIDFMETLEDRIRRMKTTTTRESTELRGEIRGHIDWQQTTKRRARSGRLEEPIFVCNQPEENYDIDENLVLKRLLGVIYEIVFEDLEPVIENPSEYEWIDTWTKADADGARHDTESALSLLRRIYERNIYLQQIDVDDVELTHRTIESVKQSRSEFYREAADLLDQFRQLMNQQLDSEEARSILDNTIISPEKTEVLFELYWIFRILQAYENVEYQVLSDWSESPSTIATWESDDARFVLSHDSTGEGLAFNETPDGETIEQDGYLYRMNAVLDQYQDLSQPLLGRNAQNSLWGGQPDIVLEKYSSDETGERKLDQVFVGEVKYSRDMDYIATGLRELLEYMAFVRSESGDYVEETEDVLNSVSVKGLLFVDSLNQETSSTGDIDILQYGEKVRKVL
ncbi:uncharacterized protein HHUB_4169 (plasmid) [Halobacterium hubeiense]|uniref:Uncharacterized protein n=1 Tax=Halobacterium hubeiense TaxID=1407499 RepID=A0A0U5H6W4_9EURY|nr:hypothetical protein [Halobacterium hubeiense]CQH63730.1 uncharacterized protein HHUB_4169 [Halobacterium hubeiense]